MNDEDVPMEDEIIASTEFNNGPVDYTPEFVIPTDVFSNPNTAHLPKNARLPPYDGALSMRANSSYVDGRSDKICSSRYAGQKFRRMQRWSCSADTPSSHPPERSKKKKGDDGMVIVHQTNQIACTNNIV